MPSASVRRNRARCLPERFSKLLKNPVAYKTDFLPVQIAELAVDTRTSGKDAETVAT